MWGKAFTLLQASVFVLICSPLSISLSGVAAAILYIADVAFFAELVAFSFMLVQ